MAGAEQNPTRLPRWWIAAVMLALAAALAAVLWWTGKPLDQSKDAPKATADHGEDPGNPGPAAALPGTEADREAEAAARLLERTHARLSAAAPHEKPDILDRLAEQLERLPTDALVAALLDELQSGRDADTNLDFVPGESGLESAPTWRVHLLGLLSGFDPRAGADYARQAIFPASNSADEWAVSLRSVLHSYPPRAADRARAEISSLLDRMLARDEWRAAPTAGMLEALDFVAHTTEPAARIPVLAAWLDQSGAETRATAVQIAIERTMAMHGDEMLPTLAKQEAPSTNANALQASAMARADFRQPPQREAVVQFLRRQPSGSQAAQIFFAAFPLHRFSVAPGLAGVPRIPDASELRASDEAALAVIEAWSDDPSLAGHSKEIAELAEKLRELTGQK
jgi:hypothetical protein